MIALREEMAVRAEEAKARKKAYLETAKRQGCEKEGDTRHANSDKGKAKLAAYLETERSKVAKKTGGKTTVTVTRAKLRKRGLITSQ
jgi:predicted phage gp36 major capsid-like protein